MGAQKRDRNQMEGSAGKNDKNSECSPATKKQKTDKKNKNKNAVRMFFQLPDFTSEQIRNILDNTTKNVDRPLILFADNDWDNYFLARARHIKANTNSEYKHDRQLDNEIDDLYDINTKLLSQYDDYESDNFLSFGIVTYFQNKSSLRNWKHFKLNVTANFVPLKNYIKKFNIREIIIPAIFPLSKTSGNAISHKLKGVHLQYKHLKYIQSKIDEIQSIFVGKNCIFTDYPVMYGKDVFMNHNSLFNEYKQQTQQEKHEQRLADEEKSRAITPTNINNLRNNNNNTTIIVSEQEDEKTEQMHHDEEFESNHERIMHALRSEREDTVTATEAQICSQCQSYGLLMDRVKQQKLIINTQQFELKNMEYKLSHCDTQRHAMYFNNHVNREKNKKKTKFAKKIVSFFLLVVFVFIVVQLYEWFAVGNGNANANQKQNQILMYSNQYGIGSVVAILAILGGCMGFYQSINKKVNEFQLQDTPPSSYNSYKPVCQTSVYVLVFAVIAVAWIFIARSGAKITLYEHDDHENEQFSENNYNYDQMITMNDFVDGVAVADIVWYFVAMMFWIGVSFVLTQKFTKNHFSVFVTMSFSGICMYLVIYILESMMYDFYGINSSMNDQQRTDILRSITRDIIFPIVLLTILTIIVACLNQNYIINWKLFAQIILTIICVYTMIYYMTLTSICYAAIIFCLLKYIIVACFTDSVRNNQVNQNAQNMQNIQTIQHNNNPYL